MARQTGGMNGMEVRDKSYVKRTDNVRYIFAYVKAGIKRVCSKFIYIAMAMAILIFEGFLIFNIFKDINKAIDGLNKFSESIWVIDLVVILICTNIMMLFCIGKPKAAKSSEIKFIRSGFINSIGEAPYLVTADTDPENDRINVYVFDTNGIPIAVWNDKKEYIETGLNITIIDISLSYGKQYVVMRFVDAVRDLPERIEWEDKNLSKEDFVLIAGIGPDSLPLEINLNKIPMVLIGGATGSGKSVLLKLLLMQSIRKGAKVVISDFKGGVDFPMQWHRKCTMCFDEDRLIEILQIMTGELERRKLVLKKSGFPNISVFNNNSYDEKLERIIFACDEIAEVLDTRGLSKEQKDKVNQIEAYLSTIARQGRAFGIHLILATQRPDANILPGQIKNNCQCKICGSCDQILSQIVLDCTDAADLIPKNKPGRFMINDGKNTIFQSFIFDEAELL